MLERIGQENTLKPDLVLRNATNMDPSNLSVDWQTTGKRALKKGQAKSSLWFKPLWVWQGGRGGLLTWRKLTFLSCWLEGGSNQTVLPMSPKPPGQVHTSRLTGVKAPLTHLNPTIPGNKRQENKHGETEERSVPVNFSAFRLRELCLALGKNRVKKSFRKTKFVSLNLFFFSSSTDRHSIAGGGSLYLRRVEMLLHLNVVLSSNRWIQWTVNISHWGLSCSVK